MNRLQLLTVRAGTVLDTVVLDGDQLLYATGTARPIIESAARRLGADDTAAAQFAAAAGWSNGHLQLATADTDQVDTGETDRPVDDAGDVILAEGWTPPVPNVLVDLREAGSDRKLRAYWVRGEGSTKINWNSDGDFTRCVSHLGKYVSDPEGLCAEYHKAATGKWPAEK